MQHWVDTILVKQGGTISFVFLITSWFCNINYIDTRIGRGYVLIHWMFWNAYRIRSLNCSFHLSKLKQRKFDFNLTTLNKCFPSEVFKAGRRWNSGAQREETADNFIWNFCFYGKPRVVSILQLCVVFTDVTHNFFKLISKLSKHVTKCNYFKVLHACNIYCALTFVYGSE